MARGFRQQALCCELKLKRLLGESKNVCSRRAAWNTCIYKNFYISINTCTCIHTSNAYKQANKHRELCTNTRAYTYTFPFTYAYTCT